MKILVWKGEEGSVRGVGAVTKGTIFTVDNARADSFIKQGKAMLKEDAVDEVIVKSIKKVKSKKSEVD